MIVKNTRDIRSEDSMLVVFGASGSGKTCLVRTLDKVLLAEAEKGAMSLMDDGIDYVEIKTLDDAGEATEYAKANGYKAIAIDSFSEVAENEIAALLEQNPNDTWKAYGELLRRTKAFLMNLRDNTPGLTVYLICKETREKDGDGRLVYSPDLPGKATAEVLPYVVDEIFNLVTYTLEDGTIERKLLTQHDGRRLAKDRSGKLDRWEEPDLGAIIRKIGGKR